MGKLLVLLLTLVGAHDVWALNGVSATVANGQVKVGCADNTVFACLVGRSGTGNDLTLSTSGNGTITGSSASEQDLILHPNSVGSVTDRNGPWVSVDGITTVTNGTAGGLTVDETGMTLAGGTGGSEFGGIYIGGHPPGLDTRSVWNLSNTVDMTLIGVAYTSHMLSAASTTVSATFVEGFRDDAETTVGTGGTYTVADLRTLMDGRITDRQTVGSGTLNITRFSTVYSAPTFGAGTNTTTRYGLYYGTAAGAATPTNSYGLWCNNDTASYTEFGCAATNLAANGFTAWADLNKGTAPSLFGGPIYGGISSGNLSLNSNTGTTAGVVSVGANLTGTSTDNFDVLDVHSNLITAGGAGHGFMNFISLGSSATTGDNITAGANSLNLVGVAVIPNVVSNGTWTGADFVGMDYGPSIAPTSGKSLSLGRIAPFYNFVACGGAGGTVAITTVDDVSDDMTLNSGCTVTNHYVAHLKSSVGTNVVGLECDAVGSGTTKTACMESNVAAASGRWTILGSGTANSALAGGLQLGASTAPNEKLEVLGNLRLDGSSSGDVVIAPAATITTYTMTLPAAQGVKGASMVNNGSGALAWSAFNSAVIVDNYGGI